MNQDTVTVEAEIKPGEVDVLSIAVFNSISRATHYAQLLVADESTTGRYHGVFLQFSDGRYRISPNGAQMVRVDQ